MLIDMLAHLFTHVVHVAALVHHQVAGELDSVRVDPFYGSQVHLLIVLDDCVVLVVRCSHNRWVQVLIKLDIVISHQEINAVRVDAFLDGCRDIRSKEFLSVRVCFILWNSSW